jgi:tetrahedral aminopeptidase
MDIKLLHELMYIFGPSGNESEIREFIIKQIKSYVDDISVDKLGNLIAHKKGASPKVMLAAHMDEIGLMIKSIDPQGRIFFSTIGGIQPLVLLGEIVHIYGKKREIHGVITTDIMSADEDIVALPKLDEMYVDTGLSKKQLKELGVEIGSYLNLEQKEGPNLGNKDYISGKALDDRVGCFILIELIKKLKNTKSEIYFVFTVQEEVGLYGAKTSAYKIEPDWAIAIDVTAGNDRMNKPTVYLGEGPCITIKDADMLSNKCINGWLEKLAKKNKIPLQLEVSDFGTTDAMTIIVSKGGVSATVLSVGVRNLHSTISIVHRRDIEYAIKLLYLLMKTPPKECLV